MSTKAMMRMLMVVSLLAALLAQPVMADPNVPPASDLPALDEESERSLHPMLPSPTRPARLSILGDVPDTIITDPLLDMRVLVILDSVDGAANTNRVILDYLEILGIPYETWDVNDRSTSGFSFAATDLSDGANHGYYYAILVSTNQVWSPASDHDGLTEGERDIIRTYERTFAVRRVTWYAFPDPPDYGLVYAGTLPTVTLEMTMTQVGQAVFSYLWPTATLEISGTWHYLSTPVDGADVTPLLDDASGRTILAIYRPGDGREHMVMTASSDHIVALPSNVHAHTLPYGIINWATKGVFLGERHFYFVPQPDDVLAWGDRWDAEQHKPIYDRGFRLEPDDLDNLVAWMHTMTTTVPNAADFKIEMPFNGDGSEEDREGDLGAVKPGTLTAKAVQLQDRFVWLNHTYGHEDLTQEPDKAYTEILSNTQTAAFLGFSDCVTSTLLTGAYSGITNTYVITTAYELGVRHLLVNWSASGYRNPSPNTGIPHPDQPEMLQIPRYANNIWYFATTPEEEVDYWFHALGQIMTYDEIIDYVTNLALGFMLDFSINPTMFHMNNLNQYSDTMSNTLMGDFVEALYGKYNALYNDDVPILSLRTQEIGERMWERMDYDASGASGIIGCGNWVTVTYPTFAGAPSPVRVPVTGVEYGDDHEVYAGQDISYLSMVPGEVVTIVGEAPTTPAKVQNVLVAAVSGGNELRWDAITVDTAGGPMTALAYRVYRGSVANFTLGEPVAMTTSTIYTDTEGTAGQYYAVVAVGDDCWKRSSEPAYTAGPTAVGPIGLDARSGLWGAWVPGLLLLTLLLVRRRDATRPNGT